MGLPSLEPWLFGLCLVIPAAAGCGSDDEAPAHETSSSDTGSAASGSFVAQPDGGVEAPPCDFLQPDCPPGQKCAAFDVDGDTSPDDARCVPVAAAAGLRGDPCELDPATGEDDCAAGLTCFDAQDGNGRCVRNCVSIDGVTSCEDVAQRCLPGGGPLLVCLDACDPRADPASDACPDPTDACYPSSDWLLCVPDASGVNGAAGDPCGFVNACDPGHACLPAAELEGCPADMCCSPFCTVDEADTCPAVSQCQPWWDPGLAPAAVADLGICRVTSR